MEVELAIRAGIAWRASTRSRLDRTGSWFFLGEIYSDLPLPIDAPVEEHCGTCRRCIDVCPRRHRRPLPARRAPLHRLPHDRAQERDPEELRPLIGTASTAATIASSSGRGTDLRSQPAEADFQVRNGLDQATHGRAFRLWSRFRRAPARLAHRRIGYERWLRNLAVGLGNAPGSAAVIAALRRRTILRASQRARAMGNVPA